MKSDIFIQQKQYIAEALAIEKVTGTLPEAADIIALMEASGQFVTAFDADWRILYIGDNAAKVIGLSVDDLLGKIVWEVLPPLKNSESMRYPQQAMAERVPLRYEVFVEEMNCWLQGQAMPLQDGGLLVIYTNSTAQRQQQQRAHLLETVVTHANDVVLITEAEPFDAPGPRIVYVNPAFTQMTGYRPEEVIGQTPRILQGPETAPQSRRYIRSKMERWESFRVELLNYRKDGTNFWVELYGQPIADERGRYTHWMAIQRDITERKQYEAALRRSEAHLHRVIDSSPNAILTLDLTGRILTMNSQGMALLEVPPFSEVIYTSWLNTWDEAERGRVAALLQEGENGNIGYFEGQGHTYKGDTRWWDVVITPLLDATGQTEMLMVVVGDVTEQRRLSDEREQLLQEAKEQADRDPLTQLLNHRAFSQKMEQMARRAGVEHPLAVIVLDLNNFKFFNDTYGHPYGDEMLLLVAGKLQTIVRPNDVVARMGGDEFALLLPNRTGEEATTFAAQLCQQMRDLGYLLPDGGQRIPIDLASGIAVYPSESKQITEVYRLADERCLRNKMGNPETLVAELYEKLRENTPSFAMLDALVTSVDNKDRYTRRHSEEVVVYSLMMAQELELSEEERHHLMVAALIHDVGKIGVPDRILRFPGPLSPVDFSFMKRHTLMGVILVRAAGGLDFTLDAVRHHHESWDGSGYPDGLKGEDIPLSARIMAVADAFSAMTTNRSYRKAMTHESALQILQEGAGKHWDALCVSAFLRAMRHTPPISSLT